MTIKSENLKIRNRHPKICGFPQYEILMIAKSCDNQMIDLGISANLRVSNLRICANSRKNHIYVILSLNYSHFDPNIGMKFARFTITDQSIFKFPDFSLIFWLIFKFPDFSQLSRLRGNAEHSSIFISTQCNVIAYI